MNKVSLLLFDAANTLIHKPTLWERFVHVLSGYGHNVDIEILKQHHKLVSEVMFFPDRTSAEFYKKFNAELLYSLGIIPTEQLLTDIFSACTYLEWVPFADTDVLKNIDLPKAILSNFNNTLAAKVGSMFAGIFSEIITSEESGCAKPDVLFYKKAIDRLGILPENILYVGDSVRLDMEPAISVGMMTCLVDRNNSFPYYPERISTLHQLSKYITN